MKSKKQNPVISDNVGWDKLPTEKECIEMSKKCDDYLKSRGVKTSNIPLSTTDVDSFIDSLT